MHRTYHASKFYFRAQNIQLQPPIVDAIKPSKVAEPIKTKKFRINTYAHQDHSDKQKYNDTPFPQIRSSRVKGVIRSSSMIQPRTQTANQYNPQKTIYFKSSKYNVCTSLLDDQDDKEEEYDKCQDLSLAEQNNKIKQNDTSLIRLMKKLPESGKSNGIQHYSNLIEFIAHNNPFFQLFSKSMIYHLLKSFRILHVAKQRRVYKKSDNLISFYVILNGKVKITNSQKTKTQTYEKGGCLGSHILFTKYSQSNQRKETAKTLFDTFLLEVNYQKYLTFSKNLTVMGLKTDLLCFQNSLYADYISKEKAKSPEKYYREFS